MEVFRLTTEIGKKYKYAEYTESVGDRYYAPIEAVKYVGVLVKIEHGGFSDDRWQRDTFDNEGEITIVDYSYQGRTSFIEIY